MLEGDPEVCPGLLNKVFLRVLTPMLPQRLTTLIVETAWNPLRLPWMQPPVQASALTHNIDTEDEEITSPKTSPSRFVPFWEPSAKQPRVLAPPSEKKPSNPPAKEATGTDLEADESHLEILGVGEDGSVSVNKEQAEPTMDESAQTSEESQTESDEANEILPSGDPMIGALVGEIEAGLVDIIPPPVDTPTAEAEVEQMLEGAESNEVDMPKGEISALADDIEAEVMKLVPVPEASDPDPPSPPDNEGGKDSPKSVIQEKDLDLLLQTG